MNELPYFCHVCMAEIFVDEQLVCPNCGNDFIELINPSNPPHEGYGRGFALFGLHAREEGAERRGHYGLLGRLGSIFSGGFSAAAKSRKDGIATDRRNYAVGPEIDDVITRLREEMEGEKDPATDEQKSKLRKIRLSSDGSCTVCLLPFAEGEEGLLFQCSHQFHEACALAWLEFQSICPNCRVPISGDAQPGGCGERKPSSQVNGK